MAESVRRSPDVFGTNCLSGSDLSPSSRLGRITKEGGMEPSTRRTTAWRGPTGLDPSRQARLVALLATGLERVLLGQQPSPPLDFPANLCVYTDDAASCEGADG